MDRIITNAVKYVKKVIEERIKPNAICIDATMGNGYDTSFMRSFLSEGGYIYAFDIQNQALEATQKRLEASKQFSKVQLIQSGHEDIDKFVKEPVDLVVYNLGYLPKGDKEITTTYDKSLVSLKKAMKLIKKNGLIIMTVYPGHQAGKVELEEISKYLKSINQKHYGVMRVDFYNYINNPPVVFLIERR